MTTKWRIHIAVVSAVCLVPCASVDAKTKAEKQAEVQKLANDTLARLYNARPSAKAAIRSAAGYAAFSNFGMKILLAGGGKGKGLAFDNKTKKTT